MFFKFDNLISYKAVYLMTAKTTTALGTDVSNMFITTPKITGVKFKLENIQMGPFINSIHARKMTFADTGLKNS